MKRIYYAMHLILMLLCFSAFVFLYNGYNANSRRQKMKEHAAVIEKDMWSFNSEGPDEYLTLAAERDCYADITIKETGGKVFFSKKGPEMTLLEQILEKIGLIPQTEMVEEVKHGKLVIGQLIARHRNMNIYIYFYVFALFALIHAVIILFLKTIQAKRRLEDRVRERTAELKDEIYERGRAEQERERLTLIIETTSDLVSMATPNERLIYMNQAGREMLGWRPADDITTKSISDVHSRWAFELVRDRGMPAAARDGIWTGETALLNVDGEEIPVSQVIMTHESPEGELEYISTIIRDMTERKRAEAEREKAAEELEKARDELELRVKERTAQLEASNKELEAFSYSVSHDLRAPLRHIDGFSQVLLEDYADKMDEDGRDYLERVRGASQQMARLIDDILRLSRVSRGEMRHETVDLSELAGEVAEGLQVAEPGRKVDVVIAPGLTARGDARLLRLVLENLLGNAWKFTGVRMDARIEFGREPAGPVGRPGKTVFFVRDNGAGFDMAYADKLFDAFQRLHTHREFTGTGIGLATVQRIIHRHGGRVRAEGEVDRGATIYFELSR